MIRTALKPGWLALLALLVAVIVSFYQLGMWQLGVSSNEASRELAEAQAARPTEPLGQVTGPHQPFPSDAAGLSVATQGSYVPELQFLVPNRLLDGAEGYWVVTPLRTEASGEAALLPVLRGFVADPDQADRPAPTPVAVTGTMAPSEAPVATDLPEGQRGSIDTADLTNDWSEPIYNTFIFLVTEEPAVTDEAVQRIPPPVFGESGIVWRNLGYGIQWFVFAGFACYMYYRFLRDATDRELAQVGPPHTSTDPHGPPAPEPARPAAGATVPAREGETV